MIVKTSFLIITLLCFSSCMLKNSNVIPNIKKSDIKKVYIINDLEGKKFELNKEDIEKFVRDFEKSEYVGKYKWINQFRVEIIYKTDEKLILFCHKNMFKIKGKGDSTYVINKDIKYFKVLFEKQRYPPAGEGVPLVRTNKIK